MTENLHCTQGTFHYLSAKVASSLYRNGHVFTHRDLDGSDHDTHGLDLTPLVVSVQNARALESGAERRTVHTNGFELVADPSLEAMDFLDNQQIITAYYQRCQDLVREATGAAIVAAFDHNIRSAMGSQTNQRIAGGQQVQPPIHIVHGDYTLTSAPQRLRDLARSPSANDTLRPLLGDNPLFDSAAVEQAITHGRYAIINVWRNIAHEPVATHPLAFCDAQSVKPENLVVFEIHYSDRVGENYFAKHDDTHQWFYYPTLTRDEVLLIKQWDSHGALAVHNGRCADGQQPQSPCTFSFHSAFDDPSVAHGAPPRWSIEVRCVAVYEAGC